MYVHMLLCTSTPTRRHVAPPLDLSGVAGHVSDPLPVLPLPFFFYFLGLVSRKTKTIFLQWSPFCQGPSCFTLPALFRPHSSGWGFSAVRVGNIKIYLTGVQIPQQLKQM